MPMRSGIRSDDEAIIAIETLELIRGMLPRRAMTLVLDWALIHRDELREGWQRALYGRRALSPIRSLHPSNVSWLHVSNPRPSRMDWTKTAGSLSRGRSESTASPPWPPR
ncbi:MAG: DUF4160 domain-containing protein [Armatimonadota bacterium]